MNKVHVLFLYHKIIGLFQIRESYNNLMRERYSKTSCWVSLNHSPGLTFGTWTKVQVHVYNKENHSIREGASLHTLYMCFQHTSTTSKMSSLHPVASQFESWTINDFIPIPKSAIVSQVYNMNYALHQPHCINSSFPFAFLTVNTHKCFKETAILL